MKEREDITGLERRFIGPETRIFYLTSNPELIKNQLAGEKTPLPTQEELLQNCSTDTLFPTRYGVYFENLGAYALTGYPEESIPEGAFKAGGFNILVAGPNFGCGSGREHAFRALKEAGIKGIVALSFHPIGEQNCINNGIFPLKNFEILRRVQEGEEIFLDEILSELDEIQREILNRGGLLPYSFACLKGEIKPPEVETGPRPMTMVEKIIAERLVDQAKSNEKRFVKPGDHAFISLRDDDLRFTYELHTGLLWKILTSIEEELGTPIDILNPSSSIVFEDHIVWWGNPQTAELLQTQADFANKYGLPYYQRSLSFEDNLAAQGICHTLIGENHALPGQIIIGPDSHTCTAGALGTLAFCVEPTELATVLTTGKALVKVPESVKVTLSGKLSEFCTAKDVMLYLLSLCKENPQIASDRILEFTGDEIKKMPLDELLVLTNMTTETGARSGIIEPTDGVIKYLVEKRGLSRKQVEQMLVKSDPDAEYFKTIEIDLSRIQPMVALPSHPQNSVPLSEVEKVKIQKAFIGSCTGGKLYDLEMAAGILKGRKIKKGVQLIISAASMEIYSEAVKRGLVKTFEEAGAWFLQPACGACIGLGPGKVKEGEVVISASNRNFPNRMGRGGIVYLANPAVVASSTVAGYITPPFN